MSVDTTGKLLGFISHEDILSYIQKNYDPNARCNVKYTDYGDIDALGTYKINPHSTSKTEHYIFAGFIYFNYKGEDRMMFYDYSNVNFLESMEYYTKYNLKNMVEAETTYVSLGCYGYSVEIIQDLLHAFHGGWIDENDCDDILYYFVPSKRWKKGGIYKRKNWNEYFIVVDVQEKIHIYNIIQNVQSGLAGSNAAVIDVLDYNIQNLNKPRYLSSFSELDFEEMQEITDGYLGQIEECQEEELLRRSEEIEN